MKAKELTTMALLAVLLSASAYIAIPLGFTPTPLTLQTMIVNLIAILLTPQQSFLTVLVYVLVGFAGLPVFSGGVGGPAKLFGPTGGYILAFLVAAPLMSFVKPLFLRGTRKLIKAERPAVLTAFFADGVLIGMTTVYLLGSIYMKFLLGKSWSAVFAAAVLPFLPLDIIKCIVAPLIAVPVAKALKKQID